jgi:hypothetical protein
MTTTTTTTESPKSNMNPAFRPIADAVKTMNRKGTGMYGNMIRFAHDAIQKDALNHVQLKGLFKEQEKIAAAELKVKMGENATYRVIKALLQNVREAGISMSNPDGTLKGKSQLEEEYAATLTPKSAIDKFKSTMNTANTLADSLTDVDAITAAALVNDLLTKVSKLIKLAA